MKKILAQLLAQHKPGEKLKAAEWNAVARALRGNLSLADGFSEEGALANTTKDKSALRHLQVKAIDSAIPAHSIFSITGYPAADWDDVPECYAVPYGGDTGSAFLMLTNGAQEIAKDDWGWATPISMYDTVRLRVIGDEIAPGCTCGPAPNHYRVSGDSRYGLVCIGGRVEQVDGLWTQDFMRSPEPAAMLGTTTGILGYPGAGVLGSGLISMYHGDSTGDLTPSKDPASRTAPYNFVCFNLCPDAIPAGFVIAVNAVDVGLIAIHNCEEEPSSSSGTEDTLCLIEGLRFSGVPTVEGTTLTIPIMEFEVNIDGCLDATEVDEVTLDVCDCETTSSSASSSSAAEEGTIHTIQASGGDYTTPQAWYDDLKGDITGDAAAPYIGEMAGETFTGLVTGTDSSTTSAARYFHLRAQSGVEFFGDFDQTFPLISVDDADVQVDIGIEHMHLSHFVVGGVERSHWMPLTAVRVTKPHARINSIAIWDLDITYNMPAHGTTYGFYSSAYDTVVTQCILAQITFTSAGTNYDALIYVAYMDGDEGTFDFFNNSVHDINAVVASGGATGDATVYGHYSTNAASPNMLNNAFSDLTAIDGASNTLESFISSGNTDETHENNAYGNVAYQGPCDVGPFVASMEYMSVVEATLDLRCLQAGLHAGGTNLIDEGYTNAPLLDSTGATRPATGAWSIGVYQNYVP